YEMCAEDAAPGLRFASSGLHTDARHRPVFSPAQGTPAIPVPLSPQGRAERLGEKPRPRRPHCLDAGIPYAVGTRVVVQPIAELNRASEADPRLRSAREWTLRFATCPRGCRLRRRAPFVRAVARTCTWTVRPSRRRLSPHRSGTRSPLLGTRSGIVAAIRIPLPRHEDDRDAPLTGAGWQIDIPRLTAKSTPQDQSPTTIFSEKQKYRARM